MSSLDNDALVAIVRRTIDTAQLCFLVTVLSTGELHARLMQPFTPDADLTIFLATSPRTRKFKELRVESRVLLAYADAKNGAYVTLSGRAELVDELSLRKKYWREESSLFWPGGPEDDDYILIRFVPSHIELVNESEGVLPEPKGFRCVEMERRTGTWSVT